MRDKAVRYRGLTCTAWGYFFLNFDFHIGAISILPRFVGFLLLLCAINFLLQEHKDLILLRPLCVFLAVFHTANWLLSFGGQTLDGKIVFFDLLVTAAVLYFHFQFLTDLAALAETCQEDGKKLAMRLRCCRTVYILLSTAVGITITNSTAMWQDLKYQKDVLILLGLAEGVVSLIIMATLFGLRKRFQKTS